jgi:hypothetical protein
MAFGLITFVVLWYLGWAAFWAWWVTYITQTYGGKDLLVTWVLGHFSSSADRSNRLFAARKLHLEVVDKPGLPGHTHPGSARLRAVASSFMDTIAKTLSLRRFDISISSRESGRGVAGARLMRTPKDLLSDAAFAPLRDGDMVTMVDTDCHLNDRELHSYAGHDIALYTLRPGSLEGHGPDSSWRFISPGVVREDVKGGASYEHGIWDWGKDVLVLSKGWRTVLYDPIVYPVGEAREVVLLLKARTIHLPLFIADWLVPGLRKCVPQRIRVEKHGKYLIGVFGPPGARKVELLDNSLPDVERVSIPTTDWSALEIMSRAVNPDSKKAELRASDVERYLKNAKVSVSTGAYYHVSDYFTVHHRKLNPICYQSLGKLTTEVGLKNGEVLAPGPVPPAVIPVNSENNNDRAVEERVVKVANETEFPEEMRKFAAEFAEMLVPQSCLGKTVPFEANEVAARQNAPSQKARRAKDRGHLALKAEVLPVQAFMKHEAGASVSDPRSINQVPVDQTTRLSRFMLASASYLKTRCRRWYAPGKNPKEMGRSLQNLVRKQGKQAGGDYSRMDGRTSAGYREFVFEPFVKRLFPVEYHAELDELLKRERAANIRMRKGTAKAKTRGANLSGSPCTTQLNTVNSAFNEYAARRRTGQTPREAYDGLGLYFGDDSVFEAAMADKVMAVANELGMKMTLEEEPEGSPLGRVVFLARVYPDVLTTTASYPSVVRCLAKLQVTTNALGCTEKGRTTLRVLKGTACNMVNGHVPIVGPYARVLEASGPTVSEAEMVKATANDRDLRWALTNAKSTPRETLSASEVDLFTASIARDLEIPPEEVRQMDARMRAAKSLADLSSIRLGGWETKLPEWAVWVTQ